MNTPSMSNADDGKLGFWPVVAIGIGGMVGGGIFAVLGLSVQLAHGGTPVAFASAGVVALRTTHSYATLSVVYPTRGSTVTSLTKALTSRTLTALSTVLCCFYSILLLSL